MRPGQRKQTMVSDSSSAAPRRPPPERDVIVAHASDVHIDDSYTARLFGGDGAGPLRAVLTAARKAKADVVLLAGDTFECHRLPDSLLIHTAATIREFSLPVVVLPGNHAILLKYNNKIDMLDAQRSPARPRRRACQMTPNDDAEIVQVQFIRQAPCMAPSNADADRRGWCAARGGTEATI